MALVTKGDQSIFEGVEKQDVEHLADFLETADGGAFLKAFSKQIKKGGILQKEMAVVEKILKKDFQSQIEATNRLKLELVKMAKAGDRRTPEKRLVDYLDTHPDIESAILELPDVVVAEPVTKRDYGQAYEVIKKKAKELFSKGQVTSEAAGFVRVVDEEPELWTKHLKHLAEQL